MKHFFNTVDLQGVGLHLEEEKAKTQEKAILQIFKLFSEYAFRTYDIEQLLKRHLVEFNHDSVKRSITCLTKQGLLIKSEKAACKGPYGKPVNVWQYKKREEMAA